MATDARPDGSRRERKKALLRVALTRAAVDLSRERGFDTVTVEQIASRAGTSSSTFFRYFGTKEDVFFGDANERFETLRQRLGEAAGAARPIAEVETALLDQIEEFANFDDDLLEAECAALWTAEPALRRRYVEIVVQWEGEISDYLQAEAGVEQSAADCRLTAMALISAVRVALEAGAEGRSEAKEIAVRGFRLLGRGVGGVA